MRIGQGSSMCQESMGNCKPEQPSVRSLTERICRKETELMAQLDTLRKAKAVLLGVPNIDEVFDLLISLPF